MNSTDALSVFIDVLKFVIPAVLVFIIAYSLLNKFMNENMNRLRIEQKKDEKDRLLPIKLQAYERMILFLERISLQNLIRSQNSSEISATALRFSMITAVSQEYSHNLSQQIYISNQAWAIIKVVKEEVLTTINQCYEGLDESAKGNDLSKAIIERLMASQNQPTQKAIDFLKAEVKLVFG
jgi:hypothetical protein